MSHHDLNGSRMCTTLSVTVVIVSALNCKANSCNNGTEGSHVTFFVEFVNEFFVVYNATVLDVFPIIRCKHDCASFVVTCWVPR